MRKLKENILSKAFIPLVIGTVAFFTTNKFPEWALLSVMGLYTGYNFGKKYFHRNGDLK